MKINHSWRFHLWLAVCFSLTSARAGQRSLLLFETAVDGGKQKRNIFHCCLNRYYSAAGETERSVATWWSRAKTNRLWSFYKLNKFSEKLIKNNKSSEKSVAGCKCFVYNIDLSKSEKRKNVDDAFKLFIQTLLTHTHNALIIHHYNPRLPYRIITVILHFS